MTENSFEVPDSEPLDLPSEEKITTPLEREVLLDTTGFPREIFTFVHEGRRVNFSFRRAWDDAKINFPKYATYDLTNFNLNPGESTGNDEHPSLLVLSSVPESIYSFVQLLKGESLQISPEQKDEDLAFIVARNLANPDGTVASPITHDGQSGFLSTRGQAELIEAYLQDDREQICLLADWLFSDAGGNGGFAEKSRWEAEKIRETADRVSENRADSPPIEVEDLALIRCVHVDQFSPIKSADIQHSSALPQIVDGELKFNSPASVGHSSGRTSVHFSLNHAVMSHARGNWDRADCVFAVDFEKCVESGQRPYNLLGEDTYFIAKPNQGVVVQPDAFMMVITKEVRTNNLRYFETLEELGVTIVEAESPTRAVSKCLQEGFGDKSYPTIIKENDSYLKKVVPEETVGKWSEPDYYEFSKRLAVDLGARSQLHTDDLVRPAEQIMPNLMRDIQDVRNVIEALVEISPHETLLEDYRSELISLAKRGYFGNFSRERATDILLSYTTMPSLSQMITEHGFDQVLIQIDSLSRHSGIKEEVEDFINSFKPFRPVTSQMYEEWFKSLMGVNDWRRGAFHNMPPQLKLYLAYEGVI